MWPVWVLVAATVFLLGFRIGLNVEASNVIDVGYAGVIGAHRIANGEAPYGHFPVQDDLKACGPADAEGEIRERVQTNGRCESSNERGDTYGPVSYLAYLPGYALFGWTGKWDDLPAAHFTSIAFDVLCMLGLALVGRRFGGQRLAATLAFAWAAYPFTQYVVELEHERRDPPAFLILGFWLAASPRRGGFVALAGWTKFARARRRAAVADVPGADTRRVARSFAGFARRRARVLGAPARAEPARRGARVLGPHARLAARPRVAVLDLGLGAVPRAGHPRTCTSSARSPQGRSCSRAVAAAFVPRRKSPLQLAALTGR